MRRRRLLVIAMGAAGLVAELAAQSLTARVNGDRIHVEAVRLDFLSGRSLERLKNGATVTYGAQLTLSVNANTVLLARTIERFGLSYDLWEEKFAATRLNTAGSKPVTHLAASAAVEWCTGHLAVPAAGLDRDRPFWLRLEVRAEEVREESNVIREPGVMLARLVEIFSRPARAAEARWHAEAGPIRLADLKTNKR